MIRRVLLSCATIASMMTAGASIPARAAENNRPPDLTGQWRLDPKRSDNPQRGGAGLRGPRGGGWGRGPGGGGMGGGPMGGGPMGGGPMGGGPGGGPPEGAPGGEGEGGAAPEGALANRPVRLPELIHVTETPELVSLEDSTGAVLQEIVTAAGQDTMAHAPGAQVMNGEWKGDKLVVRREGPRGGTLTTTVSLEGKAGDLLVIRTKIEGRGDMPAREFKRVYQRVKE